MLYVFFCFSVFKGVLGFSLACWFLVYIEKSPKKRILNRRHRQKKASKSPSSAQNTLADAQPHNHFPVTHRSHFFLIAMSASLLDYEASFASVFDNIWLQFIEPFVIEMINDPSLTEDKKNQFKAGYDTIPLASTPCGESVRIKLDAKQFALQQEGHAGAKHLKSMIDCIREYDKEIVPTEKKVSIRADANRGWTLEEASEFALALQGNGKTDKKPVVLDFLE